MSSTEPKPRNARELYDKRREEIEAIAMADRDDIVAEACRAIIDVVSEGEDE